MNAVSTFPYGAMITAALIVTYGNKGEFHGDIVTFLKHCV